MGIIYKVTNTLSGKSYVGQTQDSFHRRRLAHENLALKPKPSYYFHKALKKHGPENFEWVILEECPAENLDNREQFYIAQLDTFAPKGYNLTKGGLTTFGASGEFHYLAKMTAEEKTAWLEKHRLGQNNPNYDNGEKIQGSKHFLNQMTPKEKELWLDKHIRGDANYQKTWTPEQLSAKSHIARMNPAERDLWVEKHLRGENNPSKRRIAEDPDKYRQMFKEQGERHRGSNNKLSKKYVLTFPSGEVCVVYGLSEFCRTYSEAKLSVGTLNGCVGGFNKQYRGFKCRHFNPETDKDLPEWKAPKKDPP